MFTVILIVSILTTVLLKTHLSISKVFRFDCLCVILKPQINTADKVVVLL